MSCVIKRSFKAPNIIFYDSSLHWFLVMLAPFFWGTLFSVTVEGVTPFMNCQAVTSGVLGNFSSLLVWLPRLPIGSHFNATPLTSFVNIAPQCFWKAAIYMTLKWDHTLTLGCWIILELLSQRSTNNNSSERIFKSFTHAVCFVFSGFVLLQKRQSSVSRTRKKNKITCAFSSSLLSTLHVPL